MKIIPFLCFVFSSVCLLAQQSPVIEYAAISTFNWGLFKGKINPTHVAEMGKNTGAVTVSSISYSAIEITSKFSTVKIVARFHPDESWTRYPKLNNPEEALEHEKRHLDITEIYARKFRQLLSTKSFSAGHFQEEITRLFKDTVSQQRAEQTRYDHETNHSINAAQQQKWNTQIDKQLEALKAYSAPVVTVTFNR
jgi:hypothetical protein